MWTDVKKKERTKDTKIRKKEREIRAWEGGDEEEWENNSEAG